jgi:hypothetical protein
MIIIMAIVIGVLFVYSLLMTFLFVTVEKQYGKHFVVLEKELEERNQSDSEMVDWMREFLHILKDFQGMSKTIIKKYDMQHYPDYIQFLTQMRTLNEIIENILTAEGGHNEKRRETDSTEED